MPRPNAGPRHVKGAPIRVRNPSFPTAHVHSGKTIVNKPNEIVHVGVERRGELERRDPARERRYEWRTNDPTKNNPAVYGRRKTPARKYQPEKYEADRKLPKQWFIEFKKQIEQYYCEIAQKNRISVVEARERVKKKIVTSGQHLALPILFRKGKMKYVISFNPADNCFYWSSTRRTQERRRSNRRNPLRIIEIDTQKRDSN